MSHDTEYIDTDILIVGSECAGARAAIEAREHGLNVAVVTKGKISKSGATLTAAADIDVDSRSALLLFNQRGDERDSPEIFFEDVVKEGKYLNNQELVEIMVREAPLRVKEMVEWGMRISNLIKAPGHRYPRGLWTSGVEIMHVLKSKLKKSGAELYEYTMITDLIREGGRVCGAVGVNRVDGTFRVFRAKAVVLATGGAMRIWPLTTAPEELTGDGYAMAYRAGAELVDMEFPMFMPACVLYPPLAKGSQFPYIMAAYFGGWMLNKSGERFISKWDPERMERSTRDIIAVAVMTEILEGRGSPRGGVYVSFKHLPENLLEDATLWHPVIKNWKFDGFNIKEIFDPTREAIEAAPATHYWNGGIRINTKCETSVTGLYAAGECAGGFMGANRLSGAALTQALVTGARAGKYASQFAMGTSLPTINETTIKELREKVYKPIEAKEGISPIHLRKELQKIAATYVGPVRDETGLKSALRELGEIKSMLPRVSTKCKDTEFNMEWCEALQLENMAEVLEMVVQGSLAREESRGAMYRRDFPNTDNDLWLKNIIVFQDQGQMQIKKVPVVITRISPPRGVKKYPGEG